MKMKLVVLFSVSSIALLCYASEKPTYVNERCAQGVGVYSNIGLRSYQEDRFHYELIDKGHLFYVLDGHNGYEVAQYAKEKLPIYFNDAFGSVQEKMRIAFLRLDNDEFMKRHKKCGSTASVVFVHDKVAHFAHVGDSRALLECNRKVDFATSDHKPDRADEEERIKQLGGSINYFSGAWRVGDGLAMSRAIGDWSMDKTHIIAEPEYTKIELTEKNRFLVLATDGLWDVMTNEKVVQYLSEQSKITNSVKLQAWFLGQQAVRKNSKDNITVMVVDLLRLGPGEKK
jgi:serine/threonine protein phosphatase PrpC